MSRQFSKAQKQAVELVQDRTGEADHIKPFSVGGNTTVENCQILDRTTNKKKGAFEFKPRKWQTEFLKKWENREPHQPFMLIVIPGGGKTMAALEAARRWLAAGSDRRLQVVVPTDNLREQWKDEAHKFGIQLQTKEFGTNFKHGFQGGAVTYHLVASQPLLFRKLCSVAPTMVIFDEVHHCGDEAHFGKGITTAFELAKERLLMSGTPWKTDGQPIPYVRYDGNGFAVGDFFYDYPRALTEQVVRTLVFDYAKGSIKNDITGDVAVFSQEICEADAQKRLKTLLSPDGNYVREMIANSHRRLMECRKYIPDAGALAACIDQAHAIKIARLIKEITGCDPSVILSDTDATNDSVKEFRNSKKEWLVAVRKVTEGTDIKRLMVLCWLTNTTSELFFRQLIARVARFRDIDDYEAYVYLPADPRLIRCAQNIENAQVQAIKEEAEKEIRELHDQEMRKGKQTQLQFESFSTSHDGTDFVLVGNEAVPPSEYQELIRITEATGVPAVKVREILRLTQFSVAPSRPTYQQAGFEEMPLEDRENQLRKKCEKMKRRLAHLLSVEPKEIYALFDRPFIPVKQMGEDQLRDWLKELSQACTEASSGSNHNG